MKSCGKEFHERPGARINYLKLQSLDPVGPHIVAWPLESSAIAGRAPAPICDNRAHLPQNNAAI